MTYSGVDANQALSFSYDKDAQGLRITGTGSIVTEVYDYVSVDYPQSDTEVYTFKFGGSGGTTVATVTVVYTDGTKANLSSVSKV